MSLDVQFYKFVGRDFLTRMIAKLNKEFECKHCIKMRANKEELDRSGFDTFNKEVKFWGTVQVVFHEIVVTSEPESKSENQYFFQHLIQWTVGQKKLT